MEILAPAGSMESLTAAVRCGADAVYIGGSRFSARAAAANFDTVQMREAARLCHLHGVKLYRAMNTVITDREADEFAEEVRLSAEAGIDGIIIQDIGAAAIAAKVCPDMPLHASTQMTIQTAKSVIFANKLGFVRTVPARELDLAAITEICDTGVETEVFVHGAQCMCLSGQCYMSAMIGSRSANRGRCAQCCRLPFRTGKGMEHLLSLKDMSLLRHVDELAAAGAASFKIEGRMKRPEYVAAAVTAFRNAADHRGDREKDIQILQSVFSRSGFTDGYLTGKTGREMFGFRTYEDVKAAESILPSIRESYRRERKEYSADISVTVREGEPVKAEFTAGGITACVTGKTPERAVSRAVSHGDIEKAFAKLGDTVYTVGEITSDIDEGLAVSAAELNAIRREACERADSLIIGKNTPRYDVTEDMPEVYDRQRSREVSVRLRIDRRSQLSLDCADMLIVPHEMLLEGGFVHGAAVSLPAIVTDEKRLTADVERLVDKGYRDFYADNFTHLGVLDGFDVRIHGGSGLNITNSYALAAFRDILTDVTVSFELTAAQAAALKSPVPVGVVVYGRLPLMTVRNVPSADSLTDRTGRVFPIERHKDYAVIRNCDILDVMSMTDRFNADFAEILPCDDPEGVISRFRSRISQSGRGFTNGLYKRGII